MNKLKLFSDPFFTDVVDLFYETPSFIERSVKRTNIINGDNEYRVELAVPGLDKEDIEIKVKDNILTISHEKEETDDKTFYFTNSFTKEYTLPDDSDVKGITATVENGILAATIPKDKKKIKERVIEIV
ncbi:MAG TPA: Hsp20/alpha crystallin family protein [Candidatus Glassbacteria bacterium]|nr:Hsp20/alpha crystallin family protein [Candidatus Glassbacteria bacterium]